VDTPPLNPYASPAAPEPQLPALQAPGNDLPLYSVQAVAIAAFIGSFAAGAVIMGLNFWRVGRRSAAWWMIGSGWLGTLALMAGLTVIPIQVPSFVFIIGQTGLAYSLATGLQQSFVDEHVARGGKLASAWWAAGISLLVVIGLLACLIPLVFVIPDELLPPE
jgi:MFS family permease